MSTDGATAISDRPLVVGVLRETFPEERRVALVPAAVTTLRKAKHEVVIQSGAGAAAGFIDADYVGAGAELLSDRAAVMARADIVVQVRTAGANFSLIAATLTGASAGAVMRNEPEPSDCAGR